VGGWAKPILRRNKRSAAKATVRTTVSRVYIKDVRREQRGPQIFLSRKTAPEFSGRTCFKMKCPEIYDGNHRD